MNTICKLILVGPIALLLWACSDSADPGQSDDHADHSSQTTTDANATDAADAAEDARDAAGADQSSGAGGVTSPVNALQNDAAPGDAKEPENAGDENGEDGEEGEEEEYDLSRLESPDTALKYWIELMGEADYYGVLFASDSGSQEYENLRTAADAIEAAELSDDPQKRLVVPLLQMMFSDPWIDAEFEELERTVGVVRFTVTWSNGRELPVDVNQIDDIWRVLVTSAMLQPNPDADPNQVIPPQDGDQGGDGGGS